MSKFIAIIVAAGAGHRAGGGLPKQFRRLGGRPVVSWSAETFQTHPAIERTIIVGPSDLASVGIDLGALCDTVVSGGATRSQSVRNGLATMDCPGDVPVLIHDAARPGLSHKIIDHLLEALKDADAAAPALPVSDALKAVDGGSLKTLDRSTLRRVQTPQAFRAGDIRAALEAPDGDFVDDLEAIEALGKTVALVPGDPRLEKITYEGDIAILERLFADPPALPMRIGSGYDVHRFGPGEFVTLCGVQIPHTHGLVGHSDADIGWHALTDAILGAIANGDIGDHFPPSDPRFKDADSGTFLAYAQKLAFEAGYDISNADITLICEAPKIKPHRDAMRESTANLLNIPVDRVSVKATTTEGLGFTGREEGMAGQAVVTLTPRAKLA